MQSEGGVFCVPWFGQDAGSSCLQCRISPHMGHGPALFGDAPEGRCEEQWGKPRKCGLCIFLAG